MSVISTLSTEEPSRIKRKGVMKFRCGDVKHGEVDCVLQLEKKLIIVSKGGVDHCPVRKYEETKC